MMIGGGVARPPSYRNHRLPFCIAKTVTVVDCGGFVGRMIQRRLGRRLCARRG